MADNTQAGTTHDAVSASGAEGALAESTVAVTTPDGTCDAVFIHPQTGAYPGILLWPDGLGLRPAIRDMGRRLAAEGYAVLVPNQFYRSAVAPVFDGPFSFENEADRAKLRELAALLRTPGAAERDAAAFIAFLDAQPQVSPAHKIGTHGYCMGGWLALVTSAAVPQRVGAAASFHGGGLVTDQPDSPHRRAAMITAQLYIAIAANDDERQPEAKEALAQAFASAHLSAEVEVYPGALHGWCVPDMPLEHGRPIYNQAAAERAWGKLLALYVAALA
jgi:carboxymethylenebutenolidase